MHYFTTMEHIALVSDTPAKRIVLTNYVWGNFSIRSIFNRNPIPLFATMPCASSIRFSMLRPILF